MAHHHVEVKEELYEFKPATRSKLYILLVVGIVLAAIGLFTAGDGKHEAEGGHGGGHASAATANLVASADQEQPSQAQPAHDSATEHASDIQQDSALEQGGATEHAEPGGPAVEKE